MYGECSLLASAGPMTPHKAKELFEAGLVGDVAKMFELHKGFRDLIADVLSPIDEPGFIDGAYDKTLVRLSGLEEMPLRLLSPYRGITEAQYQECKRILHEQYPDWVAYSAR